MFTPLSKIIPKTFAKLGLTREARAALVCQRFRKIAQEVLPGELTLHIWAISFQRNILMLGVDHPAYAVEVMQRKENILQQLNEGLATMSGTLQCKVKDIRTKVYGNPSANRGTEEPVKPG